MFFITTNRNSWMSRDYREGWANSFGHLMVDSLHARFGLKIWPEPHNYLETAGTEFLRRRIRDRDYTPELESFYRASQFWLELTECIGIAQTSELFRSVRGYPVNHPNAIAKFRSVLSDYCTPEELDAWESSYPILVNNRE